MLKQNIIFLDSYTVQDLDSEASDEIGYGITSSEAIKDSLRFMGYVVHDLHYFGLKAKSKLEWIQASYNLLRCIPLDNYNFVFIFHIFHQFPTEVKRILLARGHPKTKIVGYTHGSHWDESDIFREKFFPNMKVLDLANLLCLDGVFVVSHYFRDLLLKNIKIFNKDISIQMESKLFVTGLPINIKKIDKYRIAPKKERVQVVFNHSSTKGKNPDLFFKVIDKILKKHDISLVVTRKFYPENPGFNELMNLKSQHGDRIIEGNTYSISKYYRILWDSHIQVSTASHESLGIATLEAMYTNNCCLVPKIQCYPEITENTNVYSCVENLKELLIHFINSPADRESMASKLHKRSLNYSSEKVSENISNVIQLLTA